MRRERAITGPARAPRAPVRIPVAASLLVIIAFHGVGEASWTLLEGKSQTLAGTLAGQILEHVIGRGVTMLTAAVAVIVGVPLLLACLALLASYIASCRRPVRRPS